MIADQWVETVIDEEIRASVEVRERLLEGDAIDRVALVAAVITHACANGKKVLIFGNGGSAADAQHIAAEFLGRFRRDRRPLPALALSADIASITAVGNDYTFQDVFKRQIEAHGAPGDVAIALSTSGKSENVIRGIQAATAKGMTTVGLSGEGGALRWEVQHPLCIPAADTARIQEGYMLLCHIICEIVERTLFDSGESL
jgi:D-sedoheptulose 7-phosphate isomerase